MHEATAEFTGVAGELARSRRIPAVRWLAVAALLLGAGVTSDARTEPPPPSLAEVKTLDRDGQYDQAVRRYRELLHEFPGSAEVRLGLADDLARREQCEENVSPRSRGTATLTRAAEEAVMGICNFRRGNFAAALAHLEKADGLAPGDKQIVIFLARAHAALGQTEKGIRVLATFQSTHGDDPDTLYWTGALYDQLAEQTYESMTKSYPGSYLVLETQGDQFLQQQKYDSALRAYREALQAAPNAPGLHFDLGNTYWRMAKLDAAAAELAAELKANPDHAQANYELGDIAVKQGDVQKGVPLLKKALALDPSLIEAHRSLGRALMAEREYAQAAREFSLVAKAEPSDHTVHALLANAYQRMGRTAEAQAETRKYNRLVKQQMTELQERRAQQARDPSPGDQAPNR